MWHNCHDTIDVDLKKMQTLHPLRGSKINCNSPIHKVDEVHQANNEDGEVLTEAACFVTDDSHRRAKRWRSLRAVVIDAVVNFVWPHPCPHQSEHLDEMRRLFQQWNMVKTQSNGLELVKKEADFGALRLDI